MDLRATQLLQSLREGDDSAMGDLIVSVQAELKRIAAHHLAGERRDHTLQATALVNEAYVKLIDQRSVDFEGRGHFLSVASIAMRRVLLEYARSKGTEKRGGAFARVTLFEADSPIQEDPANLIALDDLLDVYAEVDPKNARIVEMRWFGGMTIPEIAAALETSPRTVDRGWRLAQAWLRTKLDPAL